MNLSEVVDAGIAATHEVTNSTNPYPRAATIAAASCAILFIVLGVVGNLITIFALCTSRKLRMHATTWFVLSLCISDLIFCVVNLPLTASRYIHESWIHGITLCRLFPFFFYGNVATSLMSMVAITINRYILIAHYSWYDKLYRKWNIIAMISFVWIFSFAMMTPPLLEIWGTLGLDSTSFSCTILKKDGKSPKKFLFIFGILIPCAVIIFCYSCIFFRVRKSRLTLLAHGNNGLGDGNNQKSNFLSTSQKRLRRDDLQLTKMMLLIFCCFVICFLPLMILNILDYDTVSPTIHICGSILAWSSSCTNLIIYVLTNRQYRKAYEELLCRRKATDRQSHTASRSGT
ncbi:unnamed protein product [Allacma fusca]|uniref:G-protein coupled receptors family 1 profile domain-containing protein n=1 Tax=Allacma fusca TaxID=39272 RepID=A0A8J2Q0B8_9HEXA|nr:unnamed protein product [Allacma fusca]